MTKPSDFDLDAEEIVTAAVEIFEESGLEAVSMRSVSSRLGVSPVPLYSRIGNKDALVDAIADRLLADLAPADPRGRAMEPVRACGGLESSAPACAEHETAGSSSGRDATPTSRHRDRSSRRCDATASRADAAVQACRLLTWAVVGFGAVESGVEPPARGRRRVRPGGDPGGVTPADAEALFELHIRYVIEGIARDAANNGTLAPAPRRRTRR